MARSIRAAKVVRVEKSEDTHLPDLYFDSVTMCAFDGHNFRLEFSVKHQRQSSPPSDTKKVPVVRLVAAPRTIMELEKGLKDLMRKIEAARLGASRNNTLN